MSEAVNAIAGGGVGAIVGGPVGNVISGLSLIAVGAFTGNFALIAAGVSMVGSALLSPSPNSGDRAAAQAVLQIGEQPRQAVLGRVATAGSLVDAFNYGGDYGTDWEVLVIALADHRCDALEGILVEDEFYAFSADGVVAGFNDQLEVYFRDGQWDQSVPQILLDHGPGWTADDRGRGVAYAVVAYKADDPEAEEPVWPGGRPRVRFVLRGLRCYQARKDGSLAGASGAHRRDDPATWEWTENLIDCRYNWVRGIYAGDRVDQPEMLLIGRGLSAIEAPPENVFARANLCDETVEGEARYTIGAVVSAGETHLRVEQDFAAACAGVISQPQGSVEINPGQAKAVVASFTDADLIVGSTVSWSDFLSDGDDGWTNTVVPTFVDPDQGWNERSAPPRRVIDDITADGGPRETQLRLTMVTRILQAGRVGEIWRRLGRLWGRAQVTLSPRFSAIEEDDWVNWTSDRHFKGGTRTFRVEAWGSDEKMHHRLTLREISSDAFIDTAAPSDSAVAEQQTPPADLAAPGETAWTLTGTALAGVSGSIPALVIEGAIDDSTAQTIRVEYRLDGATNWISHGEFGRTTTFLMITSVAALTAYEVSIRYLVDGVPTPRRVLGPATTGAISDGGVPVDQATIDDFEDRLSLLEAGGGTPTPTP